MLARINKHYFSSFMAEAVIKSMDWFLYDNALRHERVNNLVKCCCNVTFIFLTKIDKNILY